MRINIILIIGVVSITAILLCTSIQEVRGSPSPKKRKGSSGSTSSGSSPTGSRPSTSWSGSKSKSSSVGRKWFGGGGYKPSKSGISKKSFSKGTGKKFKKALAFGAGVYIGSKVLKKVSTHSLPHSFDRRYILRKNMSCVRIKFSGRKSIQTQNILLWRT